LTYPITKHFTENYGVITTTITTAATGLSAAIDLGKYNHFAIELTSTWTTANVGIWAAQESTGTYKRGYTSTGGLVQLTLAADANRVVPIPDAMLSGMKYIKLGSEDSTGGAVAQETARTIYIYGKM